MKIARLRLWYDDGQVQDQAGEVPDEMVETMDRRYKAGQNKVAPNCTRGLFWWDEDSVDGEPPEDAIELVPA